MHINGTYNLILWILNTLNNPFLRHWTFSQFAEPDSRHGLSLLAYIYFESIMKIDFVGFTASYWTWILETTKNYEWGFDGSLNPHYGLKLSNLFSNRSVLIFSYQIAIFWNFLKISWKCRGNHFRTVLMRFYRASVLW